MTLQALQQSLKRLKQLFNQLINTFFSIDKRACFYYIFSVRCRFLDIITSKDNHIIKLYNKLAVSKKERMQSGLFVIEGLRIVQDAVSENIEIHSLIITQQNLSRYSVFLSQADLKGVKPIIISNELGNRISCTERTQGIFAVCYMKKQPDFESTVRKGGRYVVLYQLQDPGNTGTVIRTADAMGIDGIVLSQSCDIYSPKVMRSTMGSAFRINLWNNADIEYVLDIFKSRNITTYPAVISADALSLEKCNFSDGGAVIIGNEGNGIPENIVQKCDVPVTIKMKGNINSMNAGMAAGIILWEMTRI
jgi:TrmH family RNA methyltransferase